VIFPVMFSHRTSRRRPHRADRTGGKLLTPFIGARPPVWSQDALWGNTLPGLSPKSVAAHAASGGWA
jgi:hypothetical protein